jgi:hypothetical protein
VNLAAIRELTLGYAVADLALVALAVGVYWLFSTVVLKRLNPRPAALHKPLWQQAALGGGYALAAIALSVVPVWIGGGYSPGPHWQAYAWENSLSSAAAGQVWLLFAVQSLAEELAFRAIGLVLLAILLFWLAGWLLAPAQDEKRKHFFRWLWLFSGLMANLVVAIAFAVVHNGNPNLTTLSLVNIALAGLVLGQLFWLQGTPLGAWAMHWIWNAGLATLGLPVSGFALMPPMLGLGPTGARTGMLSGGAFGPEGSIVCTVALVLVWCWLIYLSYRSMHAGDSQKPAPLVQDA